MIEEVDENGDGKLSFDEFQKAMQESDGDKKLEAYAGLGGEGIQESDRPNVDIDEDDQKEEQD